MTIAEEFSNWSKNLTVKNIPEKNKKTCYKVNALSVKKISEWCRINQCLLIYYSTDYIFNGKNKNPWEESNAPNPINFYGKRNIKII